MSNLFINHRSVHVQFLKLYIVSFQNLHESREYHQLVVVMSMTASNRRSFR
jgi:hypothetical protein